MCLSSAGECELGTRINNRVQQFVLILILVQVVRLCAEVFLDPVCIITFASDLQ